MLSKVLWVEQCPSQNLCPPTKYGIIFGNRVFENVIKDIEINS